MINKQTNRNQLFTTKLLYNKDKRSDKIVTNILSKYHTPNIPNLTKTYCNSTKLHTTPYQ